MEKEPLPNEPEAKISCKCWNCDHTVVSSLENTTTHIFTKQKYFNNTQMRCLDKRCGAVTVLFHDIIGDEGAARSVAYPTSIFEYCDDEQIHGIRAEAVKVHPVETHDLSKRAEDQIAHWGEFLQRVVVDETDFGVNDETSQA